MKHIAFLIVAFALLVTGIESLHILTAWWHAGWPTPSIAVWLAIAALALVGYAWWRHSIFHCARGQCLQPVAKPEQDNDVPPRNKL